MVIKQFQYFMAIPIFYAQKAYEISELFQNFIWKIGIILIFPIPIFHASPAINF